MPPKAKITKEMIIDAGFEVAREFGIETVNARTVSEKLGCSTQPVMYHFKTIEDMKKAVYQKADAYHTAYLMDIHGDSPMLEMGLSYIRFAQTEKQLFRLLFQSDEFAGKSISELIDAEELLPILNVLSESADTDIARAKAIFRLLFLFVHGYAGMFANNTMKYDEAAVALDLERAFAGVCHALKQEVIIDHDAFLSKK
ncbi:MAG: TetR/AcrR family transcriptional regulator [Lachnospiraceae bacterium]|nr:TetR/AcrR family transcriptional regulator [Lachnospiraceae bacterium]